MTAANTPGDTLHTEHMDALKRVIEMAHVLNAPLVRIMTSKKEQQNDGMLLTVRGIVFFG